MQDNQLTTLSRYINTGFPCDKKNLPTDLHEFWNHRETLSIESRIRAMMNITMSTVCMITTKCLMSEHFSDSISNRLAQLGKNTSKKKHITRLKGHINIDQLCDRENLPTDLPESWPYKEPLHNKSGLINYGDKIITMMYQHTHKELYILSEPSEGKEDYPLQAKRFAREPKQEKQTLVQHRQNTTWKPATVVSKYTTNFYWIM